MIHLIKISHDSKARYKGFSAVSDGKTLEQIFFSFFFSLSGALGFKWPSEKLRMNKLTAKISPIFQIFTPQQESSFSSVYVTLEIYETGFSGFVF